MNQFEKIDIDWTKNENREFYIDETKIIWPYYETHIFEHFDFKLDNGINVVVIDEMYIREKFVKFINSLETYDKDNVRIIIVLSKQIENYWGVIDTENDFTIFNTINNMNNVKVFWDVATYKMKNFIFSPKIQIQSYFNNIKMDGIDTFLYGNDTFLKCKKEKRIGIHINKVSNYLRFYLAENYSNVEHKNIFCTVNKNNNLNKTLGFYPKNQELYNYETQLKEFDINPNGLTFMWYTKQFFEHTMKSDMEIVYETHTYYPHKPWCYKWTEKTIKHLFLGKPFIHTDPIAYKLTTLNGFQPCTELYLQELINFYENWDINNKTDEHLMKIYFPLLKENIDWLNNMDGQEWRERYDLALYIAKENRNRVMDLIYNTGLLESIKSLF
jgi:hypothetical protein